MWWITCNWSGRTSCYWITFTTLVEYLIHDHDRTRWSVKGITTTSTIPMKMFVGRWWNVGPVIVIKRCIATGIRVWQWTHPTDHWPPWNCWWLVVAKKWWWSLTGREWSRFGQTMQAISRVDLFGISGLGCLWFRNHKRDEFIGGMCVVHLRLCLICTILCANYRNYIFLHCCANWPILRPACRTDSFGPAKWSGLLLLLLHNGVMVVRWTVWLSALWGHSLWQHISSIN